MRILVAGALVALSGCGAEPPPPENSLANVAAAEPEPPVWPVLAGLDLAQPLLASGQRWAMEIRPGILDFTDRSGAEGRTMPFYPVRPVVKGNVARYSTKDPEGRAVVLTLTRAPCERAGEAAQPLTVELRIGERALQGCAGPMPPPVPLPSPGSLPSNAADPDAAATDGNAAAPAATR